MKPDLIREKIKKGVQTVVYEFQNKFQNFPFHYLSESDIQAELSVRLRDQLNWPIDLDLKRKKQLSFLETINLINTEYSRKIDIVCLDPILAQEEVKGKQDQNIQLSAFLWKLPVLIGIEIKLVRFDDFKKGVNICKDDAEKLQDFGDDQLKSHNLKPSWLMLCFFQNAEALDKIVLTLQSGSYMNMRDRLPDYDKIYLIDSDKILQLNL